LFNNILFDKNAGKAAGGWFIIKNDADLEHFINEILNFIKEFIDVGQSVFGDTFKYSSPVSKPSEPKSIESKPVKSISVESKSEPKKSMPAESGIETDLEYFHPKINLVEKYRCPTCFKKIGCKRTYEIKTWCLFKFLFELKNSKHNVDGVLSLDPSEFEIIELDDIKQKINVYDIVRLFINRDDRYSQQNINNPDKFPDKNEILTYDILKQSLKLEITIGTRAINPKNNTIKWIAWDVDREHNEDPRAVADAIVKYLKLWYGLTGYIELSGSIDSYHVWIFILSTDNNIAYDFDQDFRKRLKSIGIGTDPKSIERGVQTGDGGMIKLPYNIQRKEKYGHKGGRSRFIDGVDISKIFPKNLPAHWGNLQSPKINTSQKVTEEKTEPKIDTSLAVTEEKIGHPLNNILIKIFKNNEKVDGKIRCDNCPNENLVKQRYIIEIITAIQNNKHRCGGNCSFGIAIYETSIEILKPNTETVRDFCSRFMESPRKKSEFCYEIRPTSNEMFENTLVLKTITEKAGKELAGWLVNSNVLKGKLHQPAPQPFRVEKTYDFTIEFDKLT
jgi:hypothetical protein